MLIRACSLKIVSFSRNRASVKIGGILLGLSLGVWLVGFWTRLSVSEVTLKEKDVEYLVHGSRRLVLYKNSKLDLPKLNHICPTTSPRPLNLFVIPNPGPIEPASSCQFRSAFSLRYRVFIHFEHRT